MALAAVANDGHIARAALAHLATPQRACTHVNKQGTKYKRRNSSPRQKPARCIRRTLQIVGSRRPLVILDLLNKVGKSEHARIAQVVREVSDDSVNTRADGTIDRGGIVGRRLHRRVQNLVALRLGAAPTRTRGLAARRSQLARIGVKVPTIANGRVAHRVLVDTRAEAFRRGNQLGGRVAGVACSE
jgi:hypothetical protein